MKKQITSLSVHQTSKVIATMYAAMIAVLFVLPFAIYHIFAGFVWDGILMLFVLPVFYWLLLYVGHIIGCTVYNFVAKRIGGIEFEMKDVDQERMRLSDRMNLDRMDRL